MKFGWINAFGAVIVAIMLIPNLIYAAKGQHTENNYHNKTLEIIEQVGRYLSIVFLILPIGMSSFGFRTVAHMVVYLVTNALLLLLYVILWIFYFRKKALRTALPLAVIPTLIFLISGITLSHPALVLSSAVFGLSHIYITCRNHSQG